MQTHEDALEGLLPSALEMQLSGKQMEIEIVIMLWRYVSYIKLLQNANPTVIYTKRHHEIPISPTQLAEYCLALSALCYDPRQFHGHDLIGTLQHHEAVLDLGRSVALDLVKVLTF